MCPPFRSLPERNGFKLWRKQIRSASVCLCEPSGSSRPASQMYWIFIFQFQRSELIMLWKQISVSNHSSLPGTWGVKSYFLLWKTLSRFGFKTKSGYSWRPQAGKRFTKSSPRGVASQSFALFISKVSGPSSAWAFISQKVFVFLEASSFVSHWLIWCFTVLTGSAHLLLHSHRPVGVLWTGLEKVLQTPV